VSDAGQRLTQAFQRAAQRYAATAERDRVYPPDQAIRLLAHYVVISIVIGARTLDTRLLDTLPGLLEPFAPVSPMLSAIWQNALATRESSCYRQPERACKRWIDVYAQLGTVTGGDAHLVNTIRYAVAFGVGLGEASLGLESTKHWAEILDHDVLQRVNAMYLRKVMSLQQGDLEAAEGYRKQAELLAVQSSARQMFNNLLTLEIGVHAAAWDLTGVRQIAARIEPFAARYPGWVQFKHLAEGHFQRLRGDLTAACEAFERCIAMSAPDAQDPLRSIMAWPPATASYVETLVSLDRAEEARVCAEAALALCAQRGMVASAYDIVRALALAEAKLGLYPPAVSRLDTLIAQQRALGMSGLNIGASYEARARVAIWAGDGAAVEHFGSLAAEQYRHGRGSSLGARYERLMDEARNAGMIVLPQLSAFESTMFGATELGTRASAAAMVAKAMNGADTREVRAGRALQLLCDARGASAGHLYLAGQAGVELVASHACASPDDALQLFVTNFWAQQLADDAADVTTQTGAESQAAPGTRDFTDLRGTLYEPLLISGLLDGLPVHAGVAMLIPGARRMRSISGMQLTAAIAAHLIAARDTSIARPHQT
jgi:hypothetical protein